MELNIQRRGYDQNKDIKRMTYAKPWHMSSIPHGRLVRQKGGCSEGPGQSGPIQTIPESSVRCRQGISARDRNSHRSKQLWEQTKERVLESEALQVDTESHSDSDDIIGEGDDMEAINASNDGFVKN